MLRSVQAQHAFKTDVGKARSQSGSSVDSHKITIFTEDGEQVMLARQQSADQLISDEWLMAKRLATACRLSVDWRGEWHSSNEAAGSRFHLAQVVNFRRVLLGGFQTHRLGPRKTFTVSACGRYLLTISGHDVFVYKLNDASRSLLAVVRLSADQDVLNVSMDTSSGRMAVAALLDNRTGVLWDLSGEVLSGNSRSNAGEPMSLGMLTEVRGPRVGDLAEPVSGTMPVRRPNYDSMPPIVTDDLTTAQRQPMQRRPTPYLRTASDARLHSHMFGHNDDIFEEPEKQSDDEEKAKGGIPIQTQPAARYYSIGSPDDLPRSIAICPQRKCVAFGCKHGIELHWVDALTGGDLCRWFPLAAPSDHLYFLPQRMGIDSNKKLRLISSAAGPSAPSTSRSDSVPSALNLARKRTHDRGRRQSMTRLFFGSLPFPSSALPSTWTSASDSADDDRQGVLRTVDCDHYHAVPLSDGFHMLYTDPTTGLLCLGSDAPLGGPTKLIRKAVFMPPTVADDGWSGLMSTYNAGQDLRWGVRIVAAHRDGRLVLYNVPSDVFTYLRYLRSSPDIWDEGTGVMAQSDLLMDDYLTAHPNTMTETRMPNATPSTLDAETLVKTVQIDGVQIGHVGNDIVDDIAVETSHGGVRAWVFCRSGNARLLDIFVPPGHEVKEQFAHSDGEICGIPIRGVMENESNEDDWENPEVKQRACSTVFSTVPGKFNFSFDGTVEDGRRGIKRSSSAAFSNN